MSWTLGAYTNLVNPLDDEGKERRDAQQYSVFVSASGVARKHALGSGPRWTWEPTFDVGGSDYASLLDAYEAAAASAAGVTFESWDTTDTDSYTVIVYDWTDEPYTADGVVRHKVTFTIEAIEAAS
ncbi:MAG: hypothetical protein DRO14_00505 [Thermoprotei archaeon]|nr:MAG: hypothetical protein DRO14_00505 [Thermoprotei archaeon]